MRTAFALAAACVLAACHQQPATDNGEAANDAALAANQGEPEPAPAETPATPAPLSPPAPGEPGGLDNDMTPVAEGRIDPGSAQGAGQVVQQYFALIEAGRYRDAWALWSDGGRASGMTADAFAASFGRYSEYHANIGAPGRIDAGAGQRYVTVPVQVYGRLREGNREFNQRGSMTLHRAGDIPGATAEQRSWRIHSSDLRPGAAAATPAPSPTPTAAAINRRFRCTDGGRLATHYEPGSERITVTRSGRVVATLRQQRVASGTLFVGGGYTLRGKGDYQTFTPPGRRPIGCTAMR
ncbi:MAG: MliC family protein [Sphingomonas sp.]|uniref:MliC family protein n=1 Tax=Sphingomonas sp. TaxID=28214 RepID=UPI001B2B6089|nr:MliC family protein [Sphingomonas sp.]MBO9622279.1 MliC family protein [Sphingomonas sp.]